MTVKRLIVLFLSCGLLFILAACQSKPAEEPTNGKPEVTNNMDPTQPFSKGPSAPPSMKGPTGPPPGTDVTEIDTDNPPQAITEVEDITITMPTGEKADS